MTKFSTNKHLSSLIFGVIGVLVLWSIINITHAAQHYHDSIATWLLGIAFGLSNAISVYVWAIATTKELKRPAIIGAIVFGIGSAAIQISLYYGVYSATWVIAIAFGSLGPLGEALLAWLEAELRIERDNATVSNGDNATVSNGDIDNAMSTVMTSNVKPQMTTKERRNAIMSFLGDNFDYSKSNKSEVTRNIINHLGFGTERTIKRDLQLLYGRST